MCRNPEIELQGLNDDDKDVHSRKGAKQWHRTLGVIIHQQRRAFPLELPTFINYVASALR